MNNDNITRLAERIKSSSNICVFTGAGISCPSGIPDFRSADGLYNQDGVAQYPPEQIISHDFFFENTELFYEFYKSKMLYPSALPNAAHRFFAELQTPSRTVSAVTQNIDGLHQAGGSKTVAELHGSVHRNRCTSCGKSFDLDYIVKSDGVPLCGCGGVIKPEVVLYGEGLDDAVVAAALKYIEAAELLIVVGTSLTVYPAAGFIRYFRGSTLALINKSDTEYDAFADIVINDDIIRVVEALEKLIN